LNVKGSNVLDPAQIRAARALLGWTQGDLAKTSGVGIATIQRMEKRNELMTGYVSTLMRLQEALEKAGIQFIDDDEAGGYGLRLTKRKKGR
jgi:transcriptional regulator with XRE-family HTH domain